MLQNAIEEMTSTSGLPWQVAFLRMMGAVVLCGLIGFEREVRDRPAGLRTHMLVGLAATLYCLIMLELVARGDSSSDRVAMDPIRIVEAVTSGVAFLAAGMIVFSKGKVKGLTTGASLWLTAAVGLSIGLGMWLMGILTTLLALIVIRLVKTAERRTKAWLGGDDVPDDTGPGQ